ncbi:hypothetical protein LRHMDP2_236 [Lacticaseibacillus rhamnosus LRHMDP2]|uniref:Uncharacterized protein n=1 Tax=Lacticaseibacillus rhamnosus LRHMDP3 TaxID=1203259 RepID=A0AB33XVV3_LACRH|nr:hypothetical protein LRHMDP3_1016 [Lacticaseibacillus rhamnosus LRHMDP3]EKS53995.1 hypothetical protein LRHMDP2_236 [Lacticaseibacillus rhamnosus LRHMDP2]
MPMHFPSIGSRAITRSLAQKKDSTTSLEAIVESFLYH